MRKTIVISLIGLVLINLFIALSGCGDSGVTGVISVNTPTSIAATATPTPSGTSIVATPTTGGANIYTQSGGTVSQTGKTYSSTTSDISAVTIDSSGIFTLANSTIMKSGDTSSTDNSSFTGLNAGVLVKGSSTMTLSGSNVTTTGSGANGVFAYGSGSSITLSDCTINCTGQLGHAVMTSGSGSLNVTNVDMTTAGGSSGAIATDRGGGTINVTGGKIKTSGPNAPGIYSTGKITVSGASISATGSEAAVIEGANSIDITNTAMTSSMENKWGVMIYQSMSGDASGTKGTFTMTGGSLSNTATTGPLFYITNSTGVITLKGVNFTVSSGIFMKAASGSWGNSGSNGGNAIFTADGQTMAGNLLADSYSSIIATLQNSSSLTGDINSDDKAKEVNLTLDLSSTWTVTADSYLTGLTDTSGISGTTITNIVGNGHNVYYNKSTSSALGGKTYTLVNGGNLIPR
jgi:hypothetical protein